MRNRTKFIVTILALMIVAVMVYMPSPQLSHAIALSNPPVPEPMFGGVGPGPSQFYEQHNLVSDGFVPADHPDSNLVNAWGLVAGPTTPWWIADNGTGITTLYNVATGAIPAEFTVPGAGGAQGNPTGLVFNGGTGFVVNNGVGSPSAARFIFARSATSQPKTLAEGRKWKSERETQEPDPRRGIPEGACRTGSERSGRSHLRRSNCRYGLRISYLRKYQRRTRNRGPHGSKESTSP